MKTLKHKSRGESVHLLEEILVKLGYDQLLQKNHNNF